ncbi:MAG TPA: hypothetical protein VK752_28635 [Bryobacteraceae bacterium]|jgi:hypothetical protein|nr:hypothetical protein [Bryobacteraceae bacterium]
MATQPKSFSGFKTRPAKAPRRVARPAGGGSAVLVPWLRAQSINVVRHSAALRPFKREEFGTSGATPSEGHIQAVNQLIVRLRNTLLRVSKTVTKKIDAAIEEPTAEQLRAVLTRKDRSHRWVQGIEKIWDFYFELFGQRQSMPYANWLLSCDRIAADCYQAAFSGLGAPKSIPAPPPFCFMRTGFAPATMRRGIRLRRLGKQFNPFPLIQLPYHRLINPWTLGAVMHEASHNLQSDLGLSRVIPRSVARRLLKADMGRTVASVWARWNREMFADMSALLLGGPSVVGSLMDVVGRAPDAVFAFNPRGVHPTPVLRPLISVEMLRRMGFAEEAEQYRAAWMRLYPNLRAGNIPAAILDTFPKACALAVDAMCYRPFKTLGNKSYAQVVRFEKKDAQMIEEAARRVSAGVDPGIIPARYLIGAARVALDRRMARPGTITKNFYTELVRR